MKSLIDPRTLDIHLNKPLDGDKIVESSVIIEISRLNLNVLFKFNQVDFGYILSYFI